MEHKEINMTKWYGREEEKPAASECQEEASFGKWQLTVSQRREEQKRTKRTKDNNQPNIQRKSLVYRKKCVKQHTKKRLVGENLYYWNSIYFVFKIKIVVKMYGRFPLFPGSERALSVALSTSTLLWTLPMSRTFSSCQAHATRESTPLILSISPMSATVTQLFVSINLTTLRRQNHSDCSFGSGLFLLA